MTETVEERFERKRQGYWRYVKRMRRLNPLWGSRLIGDGKLDKEMKRAAFFYYGLQKKWGSWA